MRSSRLLLVLIAALAAAGFLWWTLQDGASPAPPLDALEGDDIAAPGKTPDLLQADGTHTGSSAGAGGGDTSGAMRDPRRAEGAQLTGLVQDETGRPIASAQVVLREVDPQSLRGAPFPDLRTLAETTSERDGAFTLAAPSHAWLRVVASAPGRATVGKRIASAGAHIVLTLPAAGTLHVSVLDHRGRPTADVKLIVRAGEDVFESGVPSGSLAEFRSLPPGDVTVRAIGAASSATAGPLAIRAGETTEVTLVLPRGIAVEGRVVDAATDSPVAAAEVHVSHPGRSNAAETDAQGRFGPVPGGGAGERVFLAVRAEGYVPLLEPVVLHAGGTQTVELRLVRGEPWTGVVQHADGKPAAGATVGYTPDGVAGRTPANTVSDEQGRFSLPPPPPPAPGRRVVLTARLGDALGALALRPTTPRPASITLTLAAGAVVRGQVIRPDGEPLAGVVVRLTPDWQQVERGPGLDAESSRLLATNEEGFLGLSSATGADGSWRVRGVPFGAYRITFEHDGATQARDDTLNVRADEVDAGRERLGSGLTLEGRVRDERGRAVAGARVHVAPDAASGQGRRTSTAGDGTFVFRGLAAGRHRVSATYAGRDTIVGYVLMEEDEDALIALDFDAASALDLSLSSGGKPYAGVLQVELQGDSGQARTRRSVVVRAGTVRLDDVPSGAFTLDVSTPSGLSARTAGVELSSGQTTDVTLELAPAARLRGTVRTVAGAGVAMARVALTHRGDTGPLRVLTTANASGAYDVPNLLPGPWSVAVQGRGGGGTDTEVTLEAGETRELDVKLTAAGTLDVEVRDDRGRTVANVVVFWRSEAGTSRSLLPARTDAKGRTVLTDVPADEEITVRARAADGRMQVERVRVAPDKTTRLVIRLPKP